MLATEALGGTVTEAATHQLEQFLENPADWSLEPGIDTMLATIDDVSAEFETPGDSDKKALDWLGYALLNHKAPVEKRREP